MFAFPFGESSDAAQKIIETYFDAALWTTLWSFFNELSLLYSSLQPLNENYSSIERLRDISKSLPFQAAQLQPQPTLNLYQPDLHSRY